MGPSLSEANGLKGLASCPFYQVPGSKIKLGNFSLKPP